MSKRWWFTARTASTRCRRSQRPVSATLRNGNVETTTVCPTDLLPHQIVPTEVNAISGGATPVESAAILRGILAGEAGARRDIVLVNAAAALIVGGLAYNWTQGFSLAAETIDRGAATQKLDHLIDFTQRCI